MGELEHQMDGIFDPNPAPHARVTHLELLEMAERDHVGHGAHRPLEFPGPLVRRGVRVNALAVHPGTGRREVLQGVLHRAELLPGGERVGNRDDSLLGGDGGGTLSSPDIGPQPASQYTAYWPQRRLQDAIYGSVWAFLVLVRHTGPAADDAARAAGVHPGHPLAPVVWEVTGGHVAIKMLDWNRINTMRGRLLEDPVKEVSAMQLIGGDHPHVLGSSEVLQDDQYLYSIMPFCRSGDLFGIVVAAAEDRGDEGGGGMSEPVARYWFRQLLLGLHFLQSKGVCHRDLSLENMLVDENDCLIIDMGMCLRVPYHQPGDPNGEPKDVTRGTVRRLLKPQGTCGKVNYMSPEIYQNTENFDGFAIDLWGAGVILYIMLTGFPPYDLASRQDDRFEIIVTGGLVEQLQHWGINLSDDAGHLLQWMLQLDPRDRPTLAQVMQHDWVREGEVQLPQPL